MFASDLDGDGDIDVVAASRGDNTIAWFESDGGAPPSWTRHVIDTDAKQPTSVYAIDLDGDGDIDVISVGEEEFSRWEDRKTVRWHLNDGAAMSWSTQAIVQGGMSNRIAQSVFGTDLDGDGETDFLVAECGTKISWYTASGND